MKRLFDKAGLVAALCLLLALGLFLGVQERDVAAETVIGYQTVTAFDGDAAFTTTQYSSGYLGGAFGEMVIQVSSDISPTGTLTVTPQFSSDGLSCGSAADWSDAVLTGVYPAVAASSVTVSTLNTNTLTTTVTTGATAVAYQQIAVQDVISGDGTGLMRFETMGKCFRVKLAADTTFTPTVYVWMVNTQ